MKARFTIEYRTEWGESLQLVSQDRKYPMRWCAGGAWSVTLDPCPAALLSCYGYEVVRDGIVIRQEWTFHSRKVRRGEGGDFRDAWIDPPAGTAFLQAHAHAAFDRPGYRGAGTAIPVFSLRSEEDFGVGEFYDLRKLVDWAASTGQSVIQLLPINDTTMTRDWMDSYPCNANSSCALRPQFLNLPAAGVRCTAAYRKLQAELNALPKIDYTRVGEAKLRLLRGVYDGATGRKVLACAAYKAFLKVNGEWLLPYAVFCALRDAFGTPDFRQWGEWAVYTPKKARAWADAHPEEVGFVFFQQYHLDKQLKEVCTYARAQGVVFKGDLPIGVSRTSVDAWCHPELFNLDAQAGAPPDAFAEDGQNWGFPTYNWDAMARDGYAWWKKRLRKMAEYFDAFRIDHLLGFFRIWEIPVPHKSGLQGHFSPALPYATGELEALQLPPALFLQDPHRPGRWHPRINGRSLEAYAALPVDRQQAFDALYEDFFYRRNNHYWKVQALRKLPELLSATRMLACGEDLGMIPACVPEVMAELRILSLEIQRMPKTYGVAFDDPAAYPYLSVCTTSTHDMTPLRAWWEEEDPALIQRYWREVLGREGKAPASLPPEACEQIVRAHLDSPAMLTILPLQDWLAIDGDLRYALPAEERINVPAVCPWYWRYRMHLTLEELLAANVFNERIRSLIKQSAR